MKSNDRKELKELIAKVIDVTTQGTYRYRDKHFELCWNYNDGDDYWYIAHDGHIWNIDEYLKPSQNQFKKFEDALTEYKSILEKVIS